MLVKYLNKKLSLFIRQEVKYQIYIKKIFSFYLFQDMPNLDLTT